MLERKTARKLSLVILLTILTFTSGCFLQPVNKVIREFNFIDMDAPALRLVRPIKKAHLAEWDEEKKTWVPVGVGEIPAGAYIKGRTPDEGIE